MTEKLQPLDLKELKKKVDISNAKCIYCDGEVVPNAIIDEIIKVGKTRKVLMENGIQTYWKCDNCDKITLAVLDTKIIRKPSELIGDVIKVDDKVFVNTKLVQGLLEEIRKEEKEREICAYNVADYDEGGARFQSGFASGLRHAQYLIKRWFPDVFEDENEKE